MKVALEITKKSSTLRLTDSHVFMFFSKSRNCVQPVVERIKVIYKISGSLRGRRSKGKGKGITSLLPRVSLVPKTPFPKTPFPFPFKRLPRRLNEWVIKNLRKHPKNSKFVCINSSLRFMHNSHPFVEIPRYLEIPLIDFCETSHNRRQTPKVSVA